MGGGVLPIPGDELRRLAGGSDVERGLLETLMAPPDEATLKRNKERRRSIRRKSSYANENGQISSPSLAAAVSRTRTRDNAALLEELEREEEEIRRRLRQMEEED